MEVPPVSTPTTTTTAAPASAVGMTVDDTTRTARPAAPSLPVPSSTAPAARHALSVHGQLARPLPTAPVTPLAPISNPPAVGSGPAPAPTAPTAPFTAPLTPVAAPVAEHTPAPTPPQQPRRPDDKHFRMEKALSVGYWMSVGVGAAGQIASFGDLIAQALPGHLKIAAYFAAALGAAFAEITMIGAGSGGLRRRYLEGSWKSLAAIACVVCVYATALNVIHWLPVSTALAVMFGGGSFVGFTAHTVSEHLAAYDYERKMAVYRQELARYNADLAEYNAKLAAEAEAARKAAEKAEKRQPAMVRAEIPAQAPKPVEESPITPEAARRWAREHPDQSNAMDVIRHFRDTYGTQYVLPAKRTVQRWLRGENGTNDENTEPQNDISGT
jgi:hypothetical protein